jgi:hypothetical protein
MIAIWGNIVFRLFPYLAIGLLCRSVEQMEGLGKRFSLMYQSFEESNGIGAMFNHVN